ncbi:SDR family oxidoreductase [Cryobacterium psychrophilum]|uniref:SDR family oxidoreductase n=1 Tax=Cryobacterium psychrophilum TaxID=41988 RepID=A0A4Y8KU23_9MICO|nr:SDR family oxidoreductase [Cryobacterium psychrophilum]TDW28563.1 3alpha(or 20beta)-hydroxysteroid dehydrogenase [Cryobacterium psychrophilum]TFD80438.1 SDR family oxidoreductase [Cryobacterium psychrophilum]
MERVRGKVALISGGARGLGASQARLLVQEGAKVVLGDILDDEGTALAAELGDGVRFVHLDVTKLDDWEVAVRTAVDTFGCLDILVNNAGIVNFGPIEEYTVESWNTIIAINLTGVFLGIKAATLEITKSRAGSIINISSTAGLHGYEALPGYTAAKFGVRGLTKAVALDLARYNVRVNSVHPGAIRTPMTEGLDLPQNHVALHRIGEPREVANLVLFLASDESSFSTGAEFVADGGETAGLSHYTDHAPWATPRE